MLHDNEPDVASAGAVRPEGVVPENWAEDEIIVDQRVSRGRTAAGAVVVGVLCVYARAQVLREREEAPRRRRAPTRRRRCPLSERRFAT